MRTIHKSHRQSTAQRPLCRMLYRRQMSRLKQWQKDPILCELFATRSDDTDAVAAEKQLDPFHPDNEFHSVLYFRLNFRLLRCSKDLRSRRC